jgi:hypothetical protein
LPRPLRPPRWAQSGIPRLAIDTYPVAAEDLRDLFRRVVAVHEFGTDIAEAVDALDKLHRDRLFAGHIGRKFDGVGRVDRFEVVDEIRPYPM